MKNILKIFKTDLKNISTNWVALILIGGLTFLPSLYAWFNIAAMWDPYSKTGDLPVAIVNEDAGAMVRDEAIDVGETLVSELKSNDSLDWHFLERKEAMDELEYGDLFAVIVIPENFSESLGTVLSMKPEKATVEYYVNEKINSISPKITEKGASVIVDQVSSKFISTVNGIIFEIFNEIGIELESELPDIEKFEEYLFTLEEHLPDIGTTLEGSLTDAKSAKDLLSEAEKALPEAKQLVSNGIQTIDETYSMLVQAENRLNELSPQVEADLKKLQDMTKKVNDFLTEVEESGVDLQEGINIQKELEGKIDNSIQTLDTIEAALLELKKLSNLDIEVEIPKVPEPDTENPEEGATEEPSTPEAETTTETEKVVAENPITPEQIDEALKKTEQMKAELEESKQKLDTLEIFIDDMNENVDQAFADLREIAQKTSTQLDAFVKEYTEQIEAKIYEQMSQAKDTLVGAKGMLNGISGKFPEIESILKRTQESLTDGETALEFVQGEFPYVNQKVLEMADRIRKLQDETNLNEIIELLKNDPESEENFFEEPVVLHENTLFPMENYGTGMTPFYTVLAIWVGGLLLISLLSVDVPQVGEYTSRHIYFGKLLTFLMIGLLQTLIVTVGDIFILGVNPTHPVWMVLFALMCSAIFITIIYTLVSVFGNVGKSLAIIMLVLQLSASGGTYPVELLPGFFQSISPFLPFTYAVDLMREAIGGIVWKRVGIDLGVLLVIVTVFILLGAFFKEKLSKGGKIIMEKSKESGLFH